MSRRSIYFIFIGLLLVSISCSENRSSSVTPFEVDGDTRGCGDFVVFRFSRDGTKAVTVSVDRTKISVSEAFQTFEIGKTDGLSVYAEDFTRDNYENRAGYCHDGIVDRDNEPVRYDATSGKVIIFISKGPDSYTYKATVYLENVEFVAPTTSNRFVIAETRIENVAVGWLPG